MGVQVKPATLAEDRAGVDFWVGVQVKRCGEIAWLEVRRQKGAEIEPGEVEVSSALLWAFVDPEKDRMALVEKGALVRALPKWIARYNIQGFASDNGRAWSHRIAVPFSQLKRLAL